MFAPLEDVTSGARLLFRLPSFLRHPIMVEEVRAVLRRRLEQREADFLGLVRETVYQHATSPYKELLRLAGCEYGDLKKLVRDNGVEGALHVLLRHGVYLTVDEFKGRRPVVRGRFTLRVSPRLLQNPRLVGHIPERSSGSRGTPTSVDVSLATIRDRAVNECLLLDAHGGFGWIHANWFVPGSWALSQILQYSAFGQVPSRWFFQVNPSAIGLHPRYRWSARIIRWGSLLAGVPLPRPVHVPLNAPLPIAQWMVETLDRGATPHLLTSASAAVRLCEAARLAGLNLRGAKVHMGSEPVTANRLAILHQAGVHALALYGSSEAGPIGYGCLSPVAADDHHLLHDLNAVIQPGPEDGTDRLPPLALLTSSLRPTAPLILLNVSTGDQAVIVEQPCGCPLEQAGWNRHLHTIRSYEKLTSGGMNFLDADVIRVLEEVLPARFGGGPTDYQLVEELTPEGRPPLRLLVHPAVGPLDENVVIDTFLKAIGQGPGVERVMELAWRTADLLRVERRAPLVTPSGKVLHLHVERYPLSRQQPLQD